MVATPVISNSLRARRARADGGRPVGPPNDQLGHQVVVVLADPGLGADPAVDAESRGRPARDSRRPDRGREEIREAGPRH